MIRGMIKSWLARTRHSNWVLLGLLLLSPLAVANNHLAIYVGDQAVVTLTTEDLHALPQHSIQTLTPWLPGRTLFEGPLLGDILAPYLTPGSRIIARALNDYQVDIPLSDLGEYRPIIAISQNGRAMKVRDFGPRWIIYPYDKFPGPQADEVETRMIWQLVEIRISNETAAY